MRWQQSPDNPQEEIDQHDAPTEPMMPIVPSPFAVTVPNDAPTMDGQGIPVPAPYERPFPYQDVQQNGVSPGYPVYPVLPPAPKNAKGGKRPPGGATPAYPVYPGEANKPAAQAAVQRRSSPVPHLVGVFFVLVQLLLLVRFVLRLLNFSGSTAWVGILYAVSGLFVLPFRLLLQNIAIPIPNALEIYALIAILVYGLLSRLLVRLLKALLH